MSNKTTEYERLSKIFSALANPTRLQMLDQLSLGKATVSELAEPFEMSLPGITSHLKVLEKAGLITKSKDAQFRPTKLSLKPLKKVDAWLLRYRKLWEERLNNLEIYMKELKDHNEEL